MGVLSEAAADIKADLRIAGASDREVLWFSQVKNYGETLLAQLHLLDDNTDGQIAFTALCRNFDLSQAAVSEDFGFADVECWLEGYWNVLVETLNELNEQRGAQEHVSLKLLVEELCNLWEHETGMRVTAHGQVKDAYTQRLETDAGRFVTAAERRCFPTNPGSTSMPSLPVRFELRLFGLGSSTKHIAPDKSL
jgi:hypothetical protein